MFLVPKENQKKTQPTKTSFKDFFEENHQSGATKPAQTRPAALHQPFSPAAAFKGGSPRRRGPRMRRKVRLMRGIEQLGSSAGRKAGVLCVVEFSRQLQRNRQNQINN